MKKIIILFFILFNIFQYSYETLASSSSHHHNHHHHNDFDDHKEISSIIVRSFSIPTLCIGVIFFIIMLYFYQKKDL